MLFKLCQHCSWASLHFSLWYSNILTGKWNNSTTPMKLLTPGTFLRETTQTGLNLIKLSPWFWGCTSQLTAYFESWKKPVCIMFFSCQIYPFVERGWGHAAKFQGARKAYEQEASHNDRCIFKKDLTFRVEGQHRLGKSSSLYLDEQSNLMLGSHRGWMTLGLLCCKNDSEIFYSSGV